MNFIKKTAFITITELALYQYHSDDSIEFVNSQILLLE